MCFLQPSHSENTSLVHLPFHTHQFYSFSWKQSTGVRKALMMPVLISVLFLLNLCIRAVRNQRGNNDHQNTRRGTVDRSKERYRGIRISFKKTNEENKTKTNTLFEYHKKLLLRTVPWCPLSIHEHISLATTSFSSFLITSSRVS